MTPFHNCTWGENLYLKRDRAGCYTHAECMMSQEQHSATIQTIGSDLNPAFFKFI